MHQKAKRLTKIPNGKSFKIIAASRKLAKIKMIKSSKLSRPTDEWKQQHFFEYQRKGWKSWKRSILGRVEKELKKIHSQRGQQWSLSHWLRVPGDHSSNPSGGEIFSSFVFLSFKTNSHCYYSMKYCRKWWHLFIMSGFQ